MNVQEFGPIEVGEIKAVRFDFSSETALTLSSPVVSLRVLSGTDATPQAMLSGVPAVVGLEVVQKLAPTVGGCTYEIWAFANDSDGLRHRVAGEFSVESV